MKMFSKRESGANLVEFAIVMPIILLVVIGILEVGVAFRDLLTVSNAAKEGVRIVAAMGDDPMSDCTVLTKTSSALASTISMDQPPHDRDLQGRMRRQTPPCFTNIYTLPIGTDPHRLHRVVAESDRHRRASPGVRRTATSRSGWVTDLDIAGVRVHAHPQLDHRFSAVRWFFRGGRSHGVPP